MIHLLNPFVKFLQKIFLLFTDLIKGLMFFYQGYKYKSKFTNSKYIHFRISQNP